MGSSIEAVFWDLGGVLIRTEDPAPREHWERSLGLAAGGLSDLVFKSEVSAKAYLGRATIEEVWSWVGETLKLDESSLERLASDFWAGDQLDEDLMGEIRRWKPDYRMGLISNALPDVRERLEDEWAIADAFDAIVLSNEVGLEKPGAAIYQLALDRLGVSPEQALFVDDFEANIMGARAAGLKAVRFVDRGQALEEVRELLGKMKDT